jgi:23S rRNA pseudouridine1911/1915/1917 synthase
MMKIEILYEDTDILAINKPAGLVVHYDGKTKEDSVADWIVHNYPAMKYVGEPFISETGETVFRPGIVHRLDRETSGVIVVAKTQESFIFLKEQFQNREVKKIYHAFVYGVIKENEGVITKPIGRHKTDFRRKAVGRDAKGDMREATTHYVVIDRGRVQDEDYVFIELKPRTGRTHQIRVHLRSINHPVVCDKIYASNRLPALGFKRLALHASAIQVDLPVGGQLNIEAPFPDDFLAARLALKSSRV